MDFGEYPMMIARSGRMAFTTSTLTIVTNACLFLLPSFISKKLTKVSSTDKTKLPTTEKTRTPSTEKITGIPALDGLRGLACLFVFNEHLTYNLTQTFLYGYGVDDRRFMVQFPFLRIPWSGFSMVAIFYVISGYVLSYKPLRLMRAGDDAAVHKTLVSSIFRRGLRLYLPPFAAVLICGFLIWAGVFQAATTVFEHENNYMGLHEPIPPRLDTLISQMYDALKNACNMLKIWDWASRSISAGHYDLHTWTIVIEIRSSMALFLLLAATARLKHWCRLLVVVLFAFFCVATDREDVLLFTSGMLVAEIDMMRKHRGTSISLPGLPIRDVRKSSLEGAVWLMMFIAGLFFASTATVGGDSTPGYRILSELVPACFSDRAAFLRAIGAVLTTWSVANSRLLEPIFTNSLASYLGKISFALYLVHGNVLKTIGYMAMPVIYAITGDGTRAGQSTDGIVKAWVLMVLAVVPLTFWVADIFWRAVDIPCVRFARWLEGVMTNTGDDGYTKIAHA